MSSPRSSLEDVSKFTTAHQLVAYAGLDASVFQSGKYKAAKTGVRNLKKGPVNPLLQSFYSRKVAEGKPKTVALIATSNKLLRIIYGMWRKNEPFRMN